MDTTPDKDKDEDLDIDEVEDEEESDDELKEEAVDEVDDVEVKDDLSTSQESDEAAVEEEISTELAAEESDSAAPTADAVTKEESIASEEVPIELSPEERDTAAPAADAAHIKPAEAVEIQVPEVFLHAEYRKGTGASVAKMPILVTFEVGRKSIRLGDLETLQEGFIFECENPLEAAVNICANGQLIGKGSLLNIEGRIGVRVTEIY
ncbi:MAG: FliM/FliN family flagellar motor switch protein [Puniceicoccales bacterium]|nr:FliM/FliN family flagellar motor switch protein [Puniceicoccales bacterium]